MIKSLLDTHQIFIIEKILSAFRIFTDTSYQTSLYGDYTHKKYGVPYTAPPCLHTPSLVTHPLHLPHFFHQKKSNFIFSYRAWKALENKPMTSCLRFIFFDRSRSKERGQYFGKFLGKIDEIEKWMFFSKLIWAHLKAYLISFLIKQSNQSYLYFFLILPQLKPRIWGAQFLAYFDLHTPYFFHRK